MHGTARKNTLNDPVVNPVWVLEFEWCFGKGGLICFVGGVVATPAACFIKTKTTTRRTKIVIVVQGKFHQNISVVVVLVVEILVVAAVLDLHYRLQLKRRRSGCGR